MPRTLRSAAVTTCFSEKQWSYETTGCRELLEPSRSTLSKIDGGCTTAFSDLIMRRPSHITRAMSCTLLQWMVYRAESRNTALTIMCHPERPSLLPETLHTPQSKPKHQFRLHQVRTMEEGTKHDRSFPVCGYPANHMS